MDNIRSAFSDFNDSVSKAPIRYSGLLGLSIGGSKIVNIPTRGGYVYVRLRDNLSEVVQAFNDKVSPVYDFPVLIERKGNRWYVIGRDDERYESWGTQAPFLPRHGDQHSFNRDGNGGGDPVLVYPDQFMPLLVYPSGTAGAGMLMVAPYILQRENDFEYVGNTGTQNLLVYKPTNSNAIVGLVGLDRVTGNPAVLIASGTPMPGSITGSAMVASYAPYPPSNVEPLYLFRLVSGTSEISWSNLYNVRQFIGGSTSTGSSGSGSGTSLAFQDEGVPLGTPSTVNFVGSPVSVTVSGTVARVFITGSSGGGVPSFITGSIPYAGSDGVLKESNPNFAFDETYKTLWLRGGNRNTPVLTNDQVALAILPTGTNTTVTNAMLTYGTGTLGSPSPSWNGYRSRGTLDTPTPVKSGDALMTIIGAGYDGSSFQNATRIRLYADGDWVTGAYAPSRMDFEVTPSGSTTRRTQFQVYGNAVEIPTGSTYNRGGVPIIHTVEAGSGISIDSSNPSNPIISASGGSGNYTLISDTILTGSVSSFDLTSIPGTYKHLHIDYSLRSNRAAASDRVKVVINNDTGANKYESILYYWFQPSTWGTTDPGVTNSVQATFVCGNTSMTGSYGGGFMDFVDYAATNKLKLFQTRGGQIQSTTIKPEIYDGMATWRDFSAITRITISPVFGTNWLAGSRITLYGKN